MPDAEQEAAPHQRSPVDLLRLAVAALALLACLALAVGAKNTMVGVEADLLQLADRVPSPLADFLVGLVQLLALAAPLALLAATLVLRRLRLAALLVAAPVVAAVLEAALASRLHRLRPPLLERALTEASWVAGAAFPSSAWICGAAAAAVVASPWLTRGWRRAAWWLVGTFAVTRMVTGHEVPLDVLAAIALGAMVGSAGLLLVGRPSLRPNRPQLEDALARSGLEVASLERAGVDARGSTPYFAKLGDGRRLFVKALGQDERDADLLFRAWRRLRLQNVGDELPYSTLRRAVEHEALVSLKASDAGVRTPHLVTVAAVGELAMVLAYEAVDGHSLDQVDPGELDDEVLGGVWRQVARLRRERIAHRDLRLANVFLDTDGDAWLVDFGFAELAAGDALLDADAAELLCSTYAAVGAERAVAAAVEVLGPDPVAAALRYAQPAALSTATRKAVDAVAGKAQPLRAEVLRVTGRPEPPAVQVERVSARRVAVWLLTGVAVYLLIHQLSDVDLLAQQVREADWRWLPAIAAMSALSYVAATMSAVGSVPDRLPPGPTLVAQVATSFVNWVTPANVGGLALGARFMERQGVRAAVAVTGAGINAVAGAAMHAALLGIFVVAVGAKGLDGAQAPSPRTLLWVGAAILAVSGLVAALPAGRRLVYRRALPSLDRAVQGLRELGGHPGKLALLFGGSALVTLSYAFCLVYCVEAFGGGLAVVAILAAYLVGSAIGQVAPTPGGIGHDGAHGPWAGFLGELADQRLRAPCWSSGPGAHARPGTRSWPSFWKLFDDVSPAHGAPAAAEARQEHRCSLSSIGAATTNTLADRDGVRSTCFLRFPHTGMEQFRHQPDRARPRGAVRAPRSLADSLANAPGSRKGRCRLEPAGAARVGHAPGSAHGCSKTLAVSLDALTGRQGVVDQASQLPRNLHYSTRVPQLSDQKRGATDNDARLVGKIEQPAVRTEGYDESDE